MLSYLTEIWRFLRGQPNHPIYRHEIQGWSYLSIWRTARRGCLPLMAVIVISMMACCGLITLPAMQSASEEWSFTVLAGLIGFMTGGEIIRWATGLLATALTSTVISAEIEADTFSLLHLTSVPTREVVLAKFGAALGQFRLPVLVIGIIRALFVFGLIGLVVLIFVVGIDGTGITSAGSLPAPLLPPMPAPLALSYVAALGVALLALLGLFAYYVASPALEMLIFGALGLLASAFARTRATGVAVAAGMRVLLWGISYITGQLFSFGFSLLALPAMALATVPLWAERLASTEPAALIAGGGFLTLFWLAVIVLIQVGVILVLLYAAEQRTARLPLRQT
jgi:hypothetical protein